jgi:hypothetical protein
MLLLRIILVFLGFLLLRRLLRPWGEGKRRRNPDAASTAAGPPQAVPFSEADIQDADYEDVVPPRSQRCAGSGPS